MQEEAPAQVEDLKTLLDFFSKFKPEEVKDNLQKLFSEDDSNYIISQVQFISNRCKVISTNFEKVKRSGTAAQKALTEMNTLKQILKNSPFEKFPVFTKALSSAFNALVDLVAEIEFPARNLHQYLYVFLLFLVASINIGDIKLSKHK